MGQRSTSEFSDFFTVRRPASPVEPFKFLDIHCDWHFPFSKHIFQQAKGGVGVIPAQTVGREYGFQAAQDGLQRHVLGLNIYGVRYLSQRLGVDSLRFDLE